MRTVFCQGWSAAAAAAAPSKDSLDFAQGILRAMGEEKTRETRESSCGLMIYILPNIASKRRLILGKMSTVI